jgi:flagellar hook-associated protein 3 FlgL
MIRVATSSGYDLLQQRLAETQMSYQQKQLEVTTGKLYLHRSENPAAASEVAMIEKQHEDNKQFQDNVDEALSWAKTTQAKTQEIVELLQHANELITQANNGTNPESHRKDIGAELNILLERLVTVSESKFGSFSLFSGTKSDTSPFTAVRDVDGNITSLTMNLDADTSKKKTQINQASVINYGELGGGANGLFQATASGVDIFANIMTMRDELLQGNIPADLDMSQLEANLDHVIGRLTEAGVQQQWMESQGNSLLNSEEVQIRQLENLQAADLAASMTDLSQLQTTLQATMQMISRTERMSILNFI